MSEPMGMVQRLGLVLAGAVILALTFTLGMLVGRQWTPAPTQVVTAEPARRNSLPARRGGLADSETERLKASQERLTFYQTLTAPLGPPGQVAKPVPREKARPDARPPATADAAPAAEVLAALPGTAASGGAPAPGAAAPDAASEVRWTVQVGAFKNRQQAEAVQQALLRAGFPTEVSLRPAEEGQARYRVRVGAFGAKAEAERMAERLRAERSLATYVTSSR